MKHNDPTAVKRQMTAALAAVVIATFALCGSAYCQPDGDGVVLYIQQTPTGGGIIKPGVGVYRFGQNSEVMLTAIPNPGYQFIYWLGDVADSTANQTAVYLNSPKIIIAVFERAKYEFLVFEEEAQSGPGGGGLYASAADYSQGGGGGGGGKRPHKLRGPTTPPEEEEEEEPSDFPVPEEGNDFPVPEPIPEPGTAALLAVGTIITFAQRKRGIITFVKTAK